jgi:hypothetical protein
MSSSPLPKERVDQIAGGVFIIGLGLLFLGNIDFFPGILFVAGGSSLARGLAEGRRWYSVQGALWLIGIGLIFEFGFSFPLILILIGLSMLFGYAFKPPMLGGESHADEEPSSGEALAEAEPGEAAEEVAAFWDEYDEKPKRKNIAD